MRRWFPLLASGSSSFSLKFNSRRSENGLVGFAFYYTVYIRTHNEHLVSRLELHEVRKCWRYMARDIS